MKYEIPFSNIISILPLHSLSEYFHSLTVTCIACSNPEGILVLLSEPTIFPVGVDFFLLSLDEGRVSLFFNNFAGAPGFTATASTVAAYNNGAMHNVSVEFDNTFIRFTVDEEIFVIHNYDSGSYYVVIKSQIPLIPFIYHAITSCNNCYISFYVPLYVASYYNKI